MNLKNLEYIEKNNPVTKEEIDFAEKRINGGYWFDIMGYCKNGKPEFVEITLEQRKNGLPEKYIIIEDCDEFYYCIDSVSGKISSWSQYDKDGIRERFDNFYEFFKDNLQNAMDNF